MIREIGGPSICPGASQDDVHVPREGTVYEELSESVQAASSLSAPHELPGWAKSGPGLPRLALVPSNR